MSSPFRRQNSFGKKKRNKRTTSDTVEISPQFIRKMALYVVIVFVVLFSVQSVGSYVQSHWNLSSDTLKRWTSQMSTEMFATTISRELPQFGTYIHQTDLDIPKMSNMVMEMVTTLNPEDPRTLIRREIPGFALFDGEIISSGEDVSYTDIPIESSPPMDVVMAEREAVTDEEEGGSESEEEIQGEGQDDTQENEGTQEETQEPERTTEGREVVYIYHTHSRESWLPHIPEAEEPDEAFHPEVNITQVGERLGEELEKRGIGTVVDTTDIEEKLNEAGLEFAQSYNKSRQVVETAMDENEDLEFIFDLHRDAQPREVTTTEIDGEDYARTAIVIGDRHADYEKNLAFAEELEEKIEELYPGLNRMIYTPPSGNGEYNQSLSENNILIEIGGVDNTLEESYRTAEALADAIAELYWDHQDGVSAE